MLAITIVFVIVVTLVLALINLIGVVMDNEREKDRLELLPVCMDRCSALDATYFDMYKDGWFFECWCERTQTPFQAGMLDRR